MGNEKMTERDRELVAEASKVAILEYNKVQREELMQKENKRLYNSKVLLLNYRRLNLYRKAKQGRIYQEGEVVGDPFTDLDFEYIEIDSITNSAKKTLSLMSFIDIMLHVYELECCHSAEDEAKRRYKTLYHFYIAEEKKTYAQIAEILHVSERTSKRDLQEAVQSMSVLFFGVDGLRLSL